MTLYFNEDCDNDNETTVARMNSLKKKGFCHNLRKYLREYSEVTGIHGLRYVTEKRSRTEKIIWAFFLLVSLAGCIYMIYEILYKYENSPVVVSFATEDTPLYQVPFPAVTICPEAKYTTEQFNYSKVFFELLKNEEVNETELNMFYHLSLLCDEEEEDNITSRANRTVDNTFFETIDKIKLDQESILPLCFFNDKANLCENLFTPIIIDEGICYSFNILGRREVFREHVYHYSKYYHVSNKSSHVFDIESGYKKDAGVDTYPRRAIMSGADNSLAIFFRHNPSDSDFVCNNFLQGFRVLIHNPWDVPRSSKHYFRIPFDKVVVAAMEPEMIITSDTVRRFSPEKRKCFMQNERPLQHFRYYTQSNCLLECITNYTLKTCGCVEFFMPRESNTPICGTGSSDCVEQAENELKTKELEAKISGNNRCDCKPSCTNIKYNVETSHSDFYFREYFAAHKDFNMGVDNSRWSVLQVYFKDEQFMTMERNELYGVTDLISNLGGLLGLFTGFSLISLIEIIYFCSLRIFYNDKLYGLWSGAPNN